MAIISDAEYKQFVDKVDGMGFNVLTDVEESWLLDMQFQGFDGEKVVKSFLARCKANAAAMDNLTPEQILKKVCLFYVARGASISEAVIKKMKPEEGARMTKIINGLQMVRTDKPEKSDDITVARLVACFPHKVAELLVGLQATDLIRVVGYDGLSEEVKKEVPKYMCFPQAAALFTKEGVDQAQDKAYKSWLLWLDAFSKVVKTRADKKAKIGENAQPASFYADTARKQSPMKNETRLLVQAQLKVAAQHKMTKTK